MTRQTAPELHGRNIQLLALRDSDGDLLQALFSNPEVVRYSRINTLARNESDALLRRWLEPEQDVFWKVLAPEGEVLGVIFLRGVNHVHHAAEIGYTFLPAAWGRGIASDAVSTALRHADGALGLARVEAYVSTGNRASLRILEKCGFRREGYRRADVLKNGEWQDSVLLSRLNERNLARFGSGE